MRLSMLPLAAAMEAAQAFRPGSLVAIVRADRPGAPLWISHVGFVIDGEKKRLRHASRRAGGHVLENDLLPYLRQQGGRQAWPVVGIAVFEPRDAGPRIARLPADHPLRTLSAGDRD
jgi:hypothetical protein